MIRRWSGGYDGPPSSAQTRSPVSCPTRESDGGERGASPTTRTRRTTTTTVVGTRSFRPTPTICVSDDAARSARTVHAPLVPLPRNSSTVAVFPVVAPIVGIGDGAVVVVVVVAIRPTWTSFAPHPAPLPASHHEPSSRNRPDPAPPPPILDCPPSLSQSLSLISASLLLSRFLSPSCSPSPTALIVASLPSFHRSPSNLSLPSTRERRDAERQSLRAAALPGREKGENCIAAGEGGGVRPGVGVGREAERPDFPSDVVPLRRLGSDERLCISVPCVLLVPA